MIGDPKLHNFSGSGGTVISSYVSREELSKKLDDHYVKNEQRLNNIAWLVKFYGTLIAVMVFVLTVIVLLLVW